MNILYLDHFNRHGGAQEYIIEIIKQIKGMGVVPFLPKIRIKSLAQKANGINSTEFYILEESFKHPLFYIKFIVNIIQIKKFVIKKNIKFIHCNSVPVLLLAKLAKQNQKIIFTCHDCSLSKFKLFLISICSDRIISVSETVKLYLIRNGIKNTNVVINNGFFDEPDLSDTPKTWNPLDAKIVNFGLIGRLEKWKGCELFIRAANKVLSNKKNCRFYLVGYSEDKVYLDYLKKLSKDNSEIIFVPFCNDKREIFSNIDVLVNASIECEPFGRTPVEAHIFSLPVIGPDVGGPSEIIVHNKTGLVFKTGDSDSLCNAMNELASSYQKRKEFGMEGRKRFLEMYHIEKICAQIFNLYECCL